MCGIAGIFQKDRCEASRDLIKIMTQALGHRGPDGSGIEICGAVGLGHRRLAIIDPTGGKQPLSNKDGQVWVTFNGEIYNYRELRAELQRNGHMFKTQSDTEVIVHAWEQWQEACLEKFRGMFAFAIMDRRRNLLFLARDPLGIKPLYYAVTEKFFGFASELQALRYLPDFKYDLDFGAMDQYLWLQYIPAPRTIFKNIYKLPPAHCLSIDLAGTLHGPKEYYRFTFEPDDRRSVSDWVEELDATIAESVKAHLVSDVPFGAFLSGGVDSSLVVSIISRILDTPVRTFSIGFKEAAFNEIKYARYVSNRFGTEHFTQTVEPDALAVLPDLVRHYGEPFGDSSAIPTYYVCRLAREHVPMVLSGDGADELFAGYWSYGYWLNERQQHSHIPGRLSDWLRYIQYTNVPTRLKLWRPEYRKDCPSILEFFEQEFIRGCHLSPVHQVQYMDLKTYLPNDILTKVDIVSMMHGLEVRTPFVDLQVLKLAMKVPEKLSLQPGPQGKWQRKFMLKQVAARYLPLELIHRPKKGFAVPIAKWFSPNGELHDPMRARLLGYGSPLHDFFEPQCIESMIQQNASGPLWLLLFLDEWLRQNRSALSVHPSEKHVNIGLLEPIEERQVLFPPLKKRVKTSLSKPRVLMIADVPNWIFARHCRMIERYLGDSFAFTTTYIGESFNESEFDLIYPIEWVCIARDKIRNSHKYVTGIRSHLWWTEQKLSHFTKFLATYFQSVHVVSKRLYDHFSPHLPQVEYVTHGVDTSFFAPTKTTDQNTTSVRLGWAGNRKSPGDKGFKEFIEPLGKLPGVELVFCGYSDQYLTLDEMHRFYDNLDIYICASDYEGNNNSLLEAASMARAIITTDNGTVPEYLEDQASALIVDRKLPSFIEAVLALQKDPCLRRRLGNRARETVVDQWDWKVKAAGYRTFFTNALKTGARSDMTRTMQPHDLVQHALDNLKSGDPTATRELLKKARDASPQDPKLRIILGNIYLLLQDGSTANEEMMQAANLAPGHVAAILNEAICHIQCGRFKEALDKGQNACRALA